MHIIAYVDDFANQEAIKKLKNFRKFNTKNTDKYFHLKYWVVEDKELAEQLKLGTSEESVGDVYLVRQSSEFNFNEKNTSVCGYPFHSQKILDADVIA